MAHEVFISYATDDKSVAEAVCAALERRQIPCWIAPRDARPGLDYADSIVDALDETSVMVFVLSSRSIASPHVKREVEHAANRGTQIIPFRIEHVELSRGLRYFLGTVNWIDALTPPIDRQIEYLGDTVQYFLDKKGAARTSGAVSPAGPRDPGPPPVASPSIPPRDGAVPPAAVERSPIAGSPAAPAPIGPVPAEPPPPPEPARAASIAPPTAFPERISVPKSVEVAGARPSEGIDATPRGAEARLPAAEPMARPGAHAERPPALRPETKNPVWQVVGFGIVGAALGELVGFGILAAIAGSDPDMYKFAITFAFTTIVSTALVTWGWLYAVRQPTLSPAVAGGLSGLVGGWLSAAIARATFTGEMPSSFLIAQALQSAAFGIAGGVAAGLGRSTRPAVSISIALVCVSFVRTLYLARDRDALLFLLLDLPIAIGWGIGLIACPATTAALRQPQTAGNTSTAGGAPSNPRA